MIAPPCNMKQARKVLIEKSSERDSEHDRPAIFFLIPERRKRGKNIMTKP